MIASAAPASLPTGAMPPKAERMMGWKAHHDIADMCRDSWNWQSHNPNGFADAE